MSVHFIRTLINPFGPLPIHETVYQEMLADADFFSVAPQVYQWLKEYDRLENTPLFFQEQLKNEFKKTFYQNLFIKNQTEQLFRRFEEEGIEVIPLKGPLFAEEYFGHLGARATSDIDLLIKLPELEHAMEVVKALGFSIIEDYIDGHFHRSFSKVLPESPIPLTVELHWNFLREDTACFDISKVWETSISYGPYSHIKKLSNYYTFYMICLHSWRHNLDSVRHYLDIIQVIHRLKEELDFEQLKIDTEFHQTANRILRTLSLVYLQFPYLHQVKAFSSSNYLLRNVAFKNRHKKGIWKYIDFLDYQLLSFDTLRHRLLQIKYLLSD